MPLAVQAHLRYQFKVYSNMTLSLRCYHQQGLTLAQQTESSHQSEYILMLTGSCKFYCKPSFPLNIYTAGMWLWFCSMFLKALFLCCLRVILDCLMLRWHAFIFFFMLVWDRIVWTQSVFKWNFWLLTLPYFSYNTNTYK